MFGFGNKYTLNASLFFRLVSILQQKKKERINSEKDTYRQTKNYGWNKVSLQTSMERNSSNFSYIYFFVNFENLTVKFHIL